MNEMKPYNDLNFNSALYSDGIDNHEEDRKTELSKIDGIEHDLKISEKLYHPKDILITLNNMVNFYPCIPRSYKSVINRSCFTNCAANCFKKFVGVKVIRPTTKLNSWRKKNRISRRRKNCRTTALDI